MCEVKQVSVSTGLVYLSCSACFKAGITQEPLGHGAVKSSLETSTSVTVYVE